MGAVDILRLKPAFTDEQAEALARLIDENLATKRDIADVQRDIAEVRHDIEVLRKELTDAIDSRAKDLRLEIEKVKWDVAKWVVGMGVVIIGILATIIRLSE
jgi:hypothetical protein